MSISTRPATDVCTQSSAVQMDHQGVELVKFSQVTISADPVLTKSQPLLLPERAVPCPISNPAAPSPPKAVPLQSRDGLPSNPELTQVSALAAPGLARSATVDSTAISASA